MKNEDYFYDSSQSIFLAHRSYWAYIRCSITTYERSLEESTITLCIYICVCVLDIHQNLEQWLADNKKCTRI